MHRETSDLSTVFCDPQRVHDLVPNSFPLLPIFFYSPTGGRVSNKESNYANPSSNSTTEAVAAQWLRVRLNDWTMSSQNWQGLMRVSL